MTKRQLFMLLATGVLLAAAVTIVARLMTPPASEVNTEPIAAAVDRVTEQAAPTPIARLTAEQAVAPARQPHRVRQKPRLSGPVEASGQAARVLESPAEAARASVNRVRLLKSTIERLMDKAAAADDEGKAPMAELLRRRVTALSSKLASAEEPAADQALDGID